MKKTAVILFNLGGPCSLTEVQPFLFNLFNDPAILRVPQPFRFMLAKLISARRTPVAREIYAQLGGSSPILKNTQAQAQALEAVLNFRQANPYKVFLTMRYAPPFALEVASAVKDYKPDHMILLPLYPQFSTTTTESSLKEWAQVARMAGLKEHSTCICSPWPTEKGFINALTGMTRTAYEEAKRYGKPRVLFSAHGLPEKIVKTGDPYPAQCAETVEALRKSLALPDLDSVLCFQSRVGPLKWITPSTEEEVQRAGRDKVPLVIVPIAFVSDHSETLVEIEIELRAVATQTGVPFFARVPAVGTNPLFIEALADLVVASEKGDTPIPLEN